MRTYRLTRSVLLLSVIVLSAFFMGYSAINKGSAKELDDGPDSASIPLLDENDVENPLGQAVKQEQVLDLGRNITLGLIQPMEWSLDLLDYDDIVHANVPINLDLNLGMDFPLKAEISYNPYDVRAGIDFPYVITIDNSGCEPYATIGIDFGVDFSNLEFSVADWNLVSFATNWENIDEQYEMKIPFYGVETKMGNWISYDILDKYYSLDDLLSVDISQYGVSGGIGVNVQYNLHSYVTAKASFDGIDTDLRWDDIGTKTVGLNIPADANPGDIFTMEVGDWVYHIAQDITFKVWADIELSVIGLDLIDESFDYAYTLGLGDLTFPEREDFTFESNLEVLAGRSVLNAAATWSAINFNWDPSGGELNAFDYTINIPENENIEKWFSDMNVDAAIAASIDVNFPYNIRSYYDAGDVQPGKEFDYSVIVDSYNTDPPSISWGVNGFVDLSSVEVAGFKLSKYSFDQGGVLLSGADLSDMMITPFGLKTYEIDVTNTLQLDKASQMLNDYIASALYGINPDIQFKAWVVLNMYGQMTGDVVLSQGDIVSATPFVWDEQFDTQTTRIKVPSTMNAGEKISVTYENLKYNLKITPGIKLGVTVLGGIVGFDYTFMLPNSVSSYLSKDFAADDFTDLVTVQSYGVEITDISVDDPNVAIDDNTVTGSLTVKNTGSLAERFYVNLETSGLPAGSSGLWSYSGTPSNGFPGYLTEVAPGAQKTILWKIDLGANAHREDYIKDDIIFKVWPSHASELFQKESYDINIAPDPTLADTKVIMEKSVQTTPGVGVIVPVTVKNEGFLTVNYQASVAGKNTAILPGELTTFSLAPGESHTFNYKILVDPVSTNAPGDEIVTVTINQEGIGSIQKTLVYTIPAFTRFGIEMDKAHTQDIEVDLRDGPSELSWNLENGGNSPVTVDFEIEGSTDFTLSSSQVTLDAGASDVDLVVSFDPINLKPGDNQFTLIAKVGSDIVYSQDFNVLVHQTLVAVQPKSSNEYEGEPLEYEISVSNLGNLDTFKMELVGLDSAVYTLDDDEFTLTKDQAKVVTATINVENISAVLPDHNAFGVKLTSVNYNTSDIVKSSVVIMPEIYDVSIPTPDEFVESDASYVMTFQIQNKGNVDDILTVNVQGAGDTSYQILCSNLVEGTTNQISVARGEIVTVSIVFIKGKPGTYTPSVTVVNSKQETLATLDGKFTTAFGFSPLITAAIITAWVVVAGAIILYTLSQKGYINSQRFAILGDKVGRMKANISYKLHGDPEKRRSTSKLSLKEKLANRKLEKELKKEETSSSGPESTLLDDDWDLSDDDDF